MKRTAIILCLMLWATVLWAQQPKYLDESQPMEERIDDALARMNEAEKQALLDTYMLPKTSGVPRLGIQPLVADLEPDKGLPSLECLTATWNTNLSYRYGGMVAEQARYRRVDRLYDPMWSQRTEEPFLVSRMMPPYIEGVHSFGVQVYQEGEALHQMAAESKDKLLRQILQYHLETCMNRQRPLGFLGTEAQKATAKTIAEEGIVLLRNDRDILPLKGNSVRSVWIVGNPNFNGLEEALAHRGHTVHCERFSLDQARVKQGAIDVVIFTETVAQELPTTFLNNIPVIIQAWDLGDEGTEALAAVLCGETNPSGKLPFTWKAEQEKDPPLFDLGHGLSYTTFEFSDFALSSREIPIGGDIIGTVTVTNTGTSEGSEVVQLYIHDIKSSIPKPYQELKGFQKVRLKPGESQVIQFIINESSLLFLDPETQQWWAEPGFYVAFVGNAANQLPLKARFHLK